MFCALYQLRCVGYWYGGLFVYGSSVDVELVVVNFWCLDEEKMWLLLVWFAVVVVGCFKWGYYCL